MAVPWSTKHIVLPRVNLVKTPPSVFLRFLNTDGEVQSVPIHYDHTWGTSGRSFGCTGLGCARHHLETRIASYAPVQIFSRHRNSKSELNWVEPTQYDVGILEVTSYLEALPRHTPGRAIFEIYRKNDRVRGHILYRFADNTELPIPLPFDVRPHLYRIWEMHEELKEYIAMVQRTTGRVTDGKSGSAGTDSPTPEKPRRAGRRRGLNQEPSLFDAAESAQSL